MPVAVHQTILVNTYIPNRLFFWSPNSRTETINQHPRFLLHSQHLKLRFQFIALEFSFRHFSSSNNVWLSVKPESGMNVFSQFCWSPGIFSIGSRVAHGSPPFFEKAVNATEWNFVKNRRVWRTPVSLFLFNGCDWNSSISGYITFLLKVWGINISNTKVIGHSANPENGWIIDRYLKLVRKYDII